ncbi:MAG: hypothetical protein M3063_02585, partial [Actinomycetota bacterium]|nr:hypothetical protein [Actinomycetota bacterium]
RAQSELDAAELRRLSRQRRHVIAALSLEARRLACEAGQPVSDAVGRELEHTLDAAFADADASDAVRSGRLTTALHYSGLGPLDVAAVAGAPRVRASTSPPEAKRPMAEDCDELAARRRKRSEAAEQAVREARAAVGEAERQADEATCRTAAARHDLELRRQEVNGVEQRLSDLRAAQDRARQEVEGAELARAAAERQVHAATDQLVRAQAAVPAETTRRSSP